MDRVSLAVGDRVCYQPEHYGPEKWLNGMVKEIPEHTTTEVRVVYHCNEDWDNFMDYTSALTELKDIQLGWK